MALKACPLVIILDINVVIKPIFAYIQFLKKTHKFGLHQKLKKKNMITSPFFCQEKVPFGPFFAQK